MVRRGIGWRTRALAGMLALFVCVALAVMPAVAQEAGDLPAAGEAELILVTWQGLAALIGVALSVGLTGGVGGALLIVRAVRQNEVITTAIERLYLSTPPGTQEQIRRMVDLVVEGGRLLDMVTDGVAGERSP